MSESIKVYLASPFFDDEQLSFVKEIESVINEEGCMLFSPRLGENALEMNGALSQGEPVSGDLRLRVFNDNWMNIDDADLVVAVIDDFDSGTLWELGYAYARQVPVVTITKHDYGCNLMLAHSVIGHVKSLEDLRIALKIAHNRMRLNSSTEDYGAAVAEIQYKFKSRFDLVEGKHERMQKELS